MPHLRLFNRLDDRREIAVQRTPLDFVGWTDSAGIGRGAGRADVLMEKIFVRREGMTVDGMNDVKDFGEKHLELTCAAGCEAALPLAVTVRTSHANGRPNGVPVFAIGRHSAPP